MSAVAKAKPDGLLGLSVFEARALLLGIFCEDGGKVSHPPHTEYIESAQTHGLHVIPLLKVDFEKLALKYPYKNSASASTSYRNARRKLAELVDSMATDGAAPAASAASPGGATGSSTATNTPKKRTPAQRKKAAAADSETAADDATGSPKPKRQRKSPVKKATPAKSKKLVEEEYVAP